MKNLHIALLIILFALPFNARAQVDVTFRVDMQYVDLSLQDQVVLRGDHEVLGQWEGSDLLLSEEASGIIHAVSVTFPAEAVGTEVLYKFVVLQFDGSELWEDRGNRSLTVPGGDTVLDASLFSDVAESGLVSAVTMDIEIDMQGALFDEEPPEGVALLGGRRPLQWSLDGDVTLLNDSDGDQIWEGSVTFPPGTQPDIAFKLAFLLDGVWVWEYLPGHINHLVMLPHDDTAPQLKLVYMADPVRLTDGGGTVSIDQYDAVIDALGDRGSLTEYTYYEAIRLLEEGLLDEAGAMYNTFLEGHPGGVEIDDFWALYMEKLAASGQVEAALLVGSQQAARETDANRAALLSYEQGEVLERADRVAEARALWQGLLTQHAGDSDIVGHCRRALALSYVKEGDEASLDEAIRQLKAWLSGQALTEGDMVLPAGNPPEGQWREQALTMLSRAQLVRGDHAGVQETYALLAEMGSAQQRLRRRVEAMEMALLDGRMEQVLRQVSQMREVVPVDSQGGLLYVEGRALMMQEEHEEARWRFEQVVARAPESRYARRAEQLLGMLQ